MGMYDTCSGKQIKCFYVPIFHADKNGNSGTYHSGGLLRNFEIGDKLPVKTLYYKYPNDFIIFDYEYYNDIWVVKNGCLYEYINDIPSYIGDGVYDYVGEQLNIYEVCDFEIMKGDYLRTKKIYEQGEKKIFPNGVFNTFLNNKGEYNKNRYKLDKLNEQTWDLFYDKWYKEDMFELEKQFGEYLDCYLELRKRKDEDYGLKSCDQMNYYLECKKSFRQFILKNNCVNVNKYLEWLDDEELISFSEVKEIVNEVLNET